MKKIILLTLTALMMVGCNIEIREQGQKRKKPEPIFEWNNQVVIIDSCEYISEETRGLVEHKGNCRFCKERRQKELKELVEQLKEK